MALLGPLAKLDHVSRRQCQCPWQLTGSQLHQPIVCSARIQAATAHSDRLSVTAGLLSLRVNSLVTRSESTVQQDPYPLVLPFMCWHHIKAAKVGMLSDGDICVCIGGKALVRLTVFNAFFNTYLILYISLFNTSFNTFLLLYLILSLKHI